MRDVEKTVGTMIDKQKTAFIGSIDSLRDRHNTGRTVMPVFTFVITASFGE